MLMFEWTLSFPRTGRASGALTKRWNMLAQTQLQKVEVFGRPGDLSFTEPWMLLGVQVRKPVIRQIGNLRYDWASRAPKRISLLSPRRLTVGDVARVRMRLCFGNPLACCEVRWLEFAALVVCVFNPLIKDAAKSFENFLMLCRSSQVPDFVRIILEIVKLFL